MSEASAVARHLLPCPFCGSEKVSLSWGMQGARRFRYVECERCAATCGWAEEDAGAAVAWNTRADRPDELSRLRGTVDCPKCNALVPISFGDLTYTLPRAANEEET